MKRTLCCCCLCLAAVLCLVCSLYPAACAEGPENGGPSPSSLPLTPEERAALEKSLIDSLRVVYYSRFDGSGSGEWGRYSLVENTTDYNLRFFSVNMDSQLLSICYAYELPAHTAYKGSVGSDQKIYDGDSCYLEYTIGDYYYVSGDYPVHVVEDHELVSGELPGLQIETGEGPVPLEAGQTVKLSGRSMEGLEKHTVESVSCMPLSEVHTVDGGTKVNFGLTLEGTQKGGSTLVIKAIDEKGFIVGTDTVFFSEGDSRECWLRVPKDRGVLTLRFED